MREHPDIEKLITDKSDVFGFLPVDWTITFTGGEITPLPDWNPRPPPEESEHVPQGEKPGWRKVGFTIPVSHVLKLGHDPLGQLRSADGAFLMHLAGYLFGHWLQFYEWWFDRRLSMKSFCNFQPSPKRASEFLSVGYDTWRSWPERTRQRFTNCLYMLARAHTYEWDWERFLLYYMVIDGAYRTAEDLRKIPRRKRIPHADRIKELHKAYDLHYDQGHIDKIIDLRNELFHETLWDGSRPGTAVSNEAFEEVGNLQRLALCLIPAILDFDSEYKKSNWTLMGLNAF